MFIALLNDDQQKALCQIVQFIAHVDGDDDHRESLLNAALLEESNLQEIPAAAADLDEVSGLLSAFDVPFASRALLLEAYGVALADDQLHPEEIKVIEKIASELKIDSDWLERARDYVQRALDVQHEGRDLIAGD